MMPAVVFITTIMTRDQGGGTIFYFLSGPTDKQPIAIATTKVITIMATTSTTATIATATSTTTPAMMIAIATGTY